MRTIRLRFPFLAALAVSPLAASAAPSFVVDAGFGKQGVLEIPNASFFDPAFGDAAASLMKPLLALEDGGVIGFFSTYKQNFMARIDASGAVLRSFGQNGIIKTDERFDDFALDPSGKAFVGASCTSLPLNHCSVWRYLRNGTADLGFGTGGKADVSLTGVGGSVGGMLGSANLKVDGNGRILIASMATLGEQFSKPSQDSLIVIRLTPNGTPDPSFGNSGTLVYPLHSSAFVNETTAFKIDSDGNLFLGFTFTGSQVGCLLYTTWVGVLKVSPSGQPTLRGVTPVHCGSVFFGDALRFSLTGDLTLIADSNLFPISYEPTLPTSQSLAAGRAPALPLFTFNSVQTTEGFVVSNQTHVEGPGHLARLELNPLDQAGQASAWFTAPAVTVDCDFYYDSLPGLIRTTDGLLLSLRCAGGNDGPIKFVKYKGQP